MYTLDSRMCLGCILLDHAGVEAGVVEAGVVLLLCHGHAGQLLPLQPALVNGGGLCVEGIVDTVSGGEGASSAAMVRGGW